MRRLQTTSLGIAQGDTELFSEFDSGGAMWVGDGPRERRKRVTFDQPFRSAPVVQVGMSMIDIDSSRNIRCDARAEDITPDGFDLVFRTWSDSRVARIRMTWIALGALDDADDWDV